jgi:hypothetical protein
MAPVPGSSDAQQPVSAKIGGGDVGRAEYVPGSCTAPGSLPYSVISGTRSRQKGPVPAASVTAAVPMPLGVSGRRMGL